MKTCREMLPADAARALGELRIIDVREPDEFVSELGHIPGSALVPLATLAEAMPNIHKRGPLLVVCRSGRRACQAAAQLEEAGYEQVFNLAGGMIAWNADALPSCRSPHVSASC